jgi:SAM-dependent methyltransferase
VTLNDPAGVAAEYASERGLEGRRAAYRYAKGPDAREMALAAVAEAAPAEVLEVGCGPGELAVEIVSRTGARVRALDLSPRMVELALGRGVDARVGDVQELPFDDGAFDCAVAAWMLYHVPDVDRALSELARVLRPGGRLVAVTNSHRHLAELYELLGKARVPYPFGAEEGEEHLRRHFARVERRDAWGWIAFPDRDAAQSYVDASVTLLMSGQLPPLDGPVRVRRAPTIFVAETS